MPRQTTNNRPPTTGKLSQPAILMTSDSAPTVPSATQQPARAFHRSIENPFTPQEWRVILEKLKLTEDCFPEIVPLMMTMQGEKQIAAALKVPKPTVHGDIAKVYACLGVHSRSAAIARLYLTFIELLQTGVLTLHR